MKHLQVVLEEMFKRVGDTYLPSKTEGDEWYLKHEWTEKEQEDFMEWLTNYLMTNKEARHELLSFPIRNKKRCQQAASWFNLMYGWKTTKSVSE